jgi:solute carrier family 27 fatty acid transporter 1/4
MMNIENMIIMISIINTKTIKLQSGTTGNPKASVIKHVRFYMAAIGFSTIYKVQPTDVIYCALPLYHSAGGMIGVGLSWFNACTLVFRKKFSVNQFWKDIHDHQCTVFQYIGELCRYLLAQPPSEYDHSKFVVF